MNVLEPLGVSVGFADVCDPDALRAAVADAKPGCIYIESMSNPLLRVPPIRRAITKLRYRLTGRDHVAKPVAPTRTPAAD